MRIKLVALLAGPALAMSASVGKAQMSNDEIIKNAVSAAPEAVGKNATIVDWEMKILREGTNNFTCLPNDPTTPTDDPICVDENGLAWLHAFMTKANPPAGKIGFGYMLMGESATSNADPFAPPPADGKWSEAGPHIMIFNAMGMMDGYPRPGVSPEVTQPFVMYQDTPYEHLMIPVPSE